MGFWDFALGRPTALQADVASRPHIYLTADGSDLPGDVQQMFMPEIDPMAPASKVSRRQAMQVPAVKRATDLVCGPLGMVPLELLDEKRVAHPSDLLAQPEANVARSVTMTRLFQDLMFDGIAWWEIISRLHGLPHKVRRVAPDDVVAQGGVVRVRGKVVEDPAATLIRFDSPSEGILTAGARAIRTHARLEAAAQNAAENPTPKAYFRPASPDLVMQDAEIRDVLTSWKNQRQRDSVGYVPSELELVFPTSFSPKDIQLVEARQHAVIEVARLTGIDPEDLGVSTTSRTYLSGQQKRIERLNDVLSPYMAAVVGRLNMPDITPVGFATRPDFSAYLMADDQTRLENYKLGLDMGLWTVADVARRESLPDPAAHKSPAAGPSLAVIHSRQETTA